MSGPTNKERLIKIEGLVVNLDKNFQEFKDDSKKDDVRKWKQINKNTVAIASQKAVSGVIAFVISIGTTLLATYFGVKHQ